MNQKNASIFALVASLILLAGCETRLERSELYFGLSRQSAADISAVEWQAFVDEVITPQFPNGLTVLDGNGQWQLHDGTLAREKSKVVIVVHECTKDDSRKLDEIREAYKKRFSQEAVLEVDEAVRTKF